MFVIFFIYFIKKLINKSVKLYLPSDLTTHLTNNNNSPGHHLLGSKLDFKNNCIGAVGTGGGGGGGGGVGGGGGGGSGGGTSSSGATSSLGLSPSSPDSQQFNIFPAIFSRQLNFSTGSCGQSKLMDELRPNLVGGLLGLQQGLLDEHALAHGNLQHSSQDSKFMSLQDNRLMGISSHENRLLGLTQQQEARSTSTAGDHKSSIQRKCSSTPEDFSALYGGIPSSGIGDTSSHHHTPAHTPPTRLSDHTVSGKFFFLFFLSYFHSLKFYIYAERIKRTDDDVQLILYTIKQ